MDYLHSSRQTPNRHDKLVREYSLDKKALIQDNELESKTTDSEKVDGNVLSTVAEIIGAVVEAIFS